MCIMFKKRGVKKIQITPDDDLDSQGKEIRQRQQLKKPLPSFHEDEDLEDDIDDEIANLSKFQHNSQPKKSSPIFQKKRINTLKFDSMPQASFSANQQADSTLNRKKKTINDLTVNIKSTPTPTPTFHSLAEPKPEVWNMDDMEDEEDSDLVVLTEKQKEMLLQKRMTHGTFSSLGSRNSQKEILKQENEYAKLLNQDDLEELNAIYNKGKGATATLDNAKKLQLPGNGRLPEDEDRLDQALLSNEHFVEDHNTMMGGHSKLALSEREKQIESLQRKRYITEQLDAYGDHVVRAPHPKDMTQRGSVLQIRQELQNSQETLMSELNEIKLELSKLTKELD